MKKLLILAIVLSTSIAFATHPSEEKNKKQSIKVALLLDTSNSMDGLINQAKAQLWEIVNELSYAKYGIQKPNLEIALYEYGNSTLPMEEGYIRQVLQFSNDLDEISEQLFSLTTNGGQEYCGAAIQTSLQELSWGKNKDDLRLLFIAGNEPFTQGKINYEEAIADAKEKDVIINTIYCGSYSTGVAGMWKHGADIGGGDYMTINHNKKIIHIITPYDTEILILNKQLNDTYIFYGNKGYQKYASQRKQDLNAETLEAPVAVKRTITKSSHLYNNSSWDLVDAVNKGSVAIEKVDKSKLPKALQDTTTEELKKIISKQTRKRKEIQAKIKELDKKRRKFVNEKQKSGAKKDELNSVLIQAIKRQAKLKNYSW